MADTIDEQMAADEQKNPFDAHDPEDIAEKEKEVARLKAKKLRVVEAIMSNEDGRAWMLDVLMVYCHTLDENHMRDTPSRNAKFEGERAVGLRLLTDVLIAAPEMFWRMKCEADERAMK